MSGVPSQDLLIIMPVISLRRLGTCNRKHGSHAAHRNCYGVNSWKTVNMYYPHWLIKS